jgi:hypothetical protein
VSRPSSCHAVDCRGDVGHAATLDRDFRVRTCARQLYCDPGRREGAGWGAIAIATFAAADPLLN